MARPERPTFEQNFFDVATTVAKRADCTRLQVGAVVTQGNRIWATGYNGPPESGQPGCLQGACPRGQFTHDEIPGYQEGNHDYSDCIAIHAEFNAIYQFDRIRKVVAISPYGADLKFIWVTHKPCRDCLQFIQIMGIIPRWPEQSPQEIGKE